jgi:hypothetical protein
MTRKRRTPLEWNEYSRTIDEGEIRARYAVDGHILRVTAGGAEKVTSYHGGSCEMLVGMLALEMFFEAKHARS